MKKFFKLEDLDCVLCAEKMQDGVKKVKGVKDASVSFMAQKMTIEFENEANEKEVIEEVVKVCKKIEPDFTIVR